MVARLTRIIPLLLLLAFVAGVVYVVAAWRYSPARAKEILIKAFTVLNVALAAFCFSMTIGVLWEFFEFGMDRLFHMDMQKDTIVHTISSVMLDPTNSNIPITIDGITSVAVNGRDLGFHGYLDIGLYDTMEDLFVNFIGATVFSVIGYFYLKHRGEGKFAKAFIPTIEETDKEPDSDHVKEPSQEAENRDN